MKTLIKLILLLSMFVFVRSVNAQDDNMQRNKARGNYQDTSKSDKMMQQDKTSPMYQNKADTMRMRKNRPGMEYKNNRVNPNDRFKRNSSDSDPIRQMNNKNSNTPSSMPPDTIH